MDPIPFTIPSGASEPMEDIVVNYFDDAKYEAEVEGLILLIRVNESTKNPHLVMFDSERVAIFEIIDYKDSRSTSVGCKCCTKCLLNFLFVCIIEMLCYSSTNCEEVDGLAPIMVTSEEECCLQSPFQPRSFEVLVTSLKASTGLGCAQCIGKENYLSSLYYEMEWWTCYTQ